MDEKTLKAYAENAKRYSEDWLSQPTPSDLYELIQKYFRPQGKTADIGCGNGRDAFWMSQQGLKVTGYDSSDELLSEARKNFPGVEFRKAFLPDLREISEQFDNVLCETVIMHLPKGQIATAVQNLKRILNPNGILYLSWRVTESEDARHDDGRLYSAFEPRVVLDLFEPNSILHFEDVTSKSSGKRICRLVYRQ